MAKILTKEKEIHKKAFEYYFALGKYRNLKKVAEEFNKSIVAINNWNVSFKWQERVKVRDKAVNKEFERKANETIADIKNNYHSFLKALIGQAVQDFKAGKLKIENPIDLIRIISLDLEILGEGDGSNSGMMQELSQAIDAGRKMYEQERKKMLAEKEKEKEEDETSGDAE